MKEQSVRITNPAGLHARPAVKLAQLAAGFDANVQLRLDEGQWIKAKSVAKVMKLKAGVGTTLHLRAEGGDADVALQALVDFVNHDFDEGPRSQQTYPSTHGHAETLYSTVMLLSEVNSKIIFGEIASSGIAVGKLYHLKQQHSQNYSQGSPEQEIYALNKALSQAKEQLNALAAQPDKLASEIISFQLELLSDEDFLAPAKDAITNGQSAPLAWENLLSNEVLDYEVSTDAYFRGRAADLRDLRERVAELLSGTVERDGIPKRSIIVTDELTPSKFLELDTSRLAGVAMTAGSYTGHVSMLARARGVPLLINLQTKTGSLPEVEVVLVAEEKGMLLLEPDAETLKYYSELHHARRQEEERLQDYLSRPAQTATGERISLYINVDDPALLESVSPEHCDGIGLTRTEFLFYNRTELPDEETQYQGYKRLLEWANGKPVTIRTLDAGGDKPIPDYTVVENNPFLGMRGLRLSLAKPDIFKVQLRALARAAFHGQLKVMFPMVTLPSELEQAKQLFLEQIELLRASNIDCAVPALGMMVEVPAAALRIADFKADFFSVGSNDLIQYVMAAGRDTSGLAHLQDGLNPAVLELIERVAKYGLSQGIEVSVCGEMVSQAKVIPALLDIGIKTLSVLASSLAFVKVELAKYGQK
jgi:phosphoenolpyruvate-protein phosphotransferase (PTS system enzyme I)